MQQPINRAPEVRWQGAVALAAEPSGVCRTRAQFTEQLLAEGVAFQVENLNGAVEDGVDATLDPELDDLIEGIREVREVSPLAAFVLAEKLRVFLVLSGYANEDELPRYEPRRRNRGA